MEVDGFTIKALSADTFALFEALNDRNGGMFARCWCTHFHPDCDERGQSAEGNRELKRRWTAEGLTHAALVCEGEDEDEQALAWAQYGTPEELPGIHHRKQYLAEADLIPDYRITCIVVDKRRRGEGLTAVAIRGALALVAEAGGGVVEGYPHVLDPDAKRVNPSFIYNSTRATYERVGFEFVRDKGMKNCVMRTTVEPAGR